MSLFTEGETNQTAEETPKETTSYVKTLTELKGNQWSDPEVIAKGKIDADNYITELEAKIAELSKHANQSNKIDELIAKIGQKAAEPTNANTQSNTGSTKEVNTKPSFSEDQIQSLVEQTLTERERKRTVEQNILQVESQLEQLFGTEAKKTVTEKAKNLGMSLQRLQEIAAESPTAFFTLIGEKPKEVRPNITGTIRTESVATQSTGKRNQAYYSQLRKSNRNQFYSAETQRQMMADRQKLGNDFYN